MIGYLDFINILITIAFSNVNPLMSYSVYNYTRNSAACPEKIDVRYFFTIPLPARGSRNGPVSAAPEHHVSR
jgi:hypothetical protein